jgi:chromosome segregation ATPase
VARLRSEADEREGRMADATEQARGLQGEVERLTRDLDEANTRQQQQGSGGSGSGDVDEARKEIRILEAQLEHSHAAIDSASTRADSLERQVEAERKSKTELEGRLADLTDQMDELTDALDAEKRARADDAAGQLFLGNWILAGVAGD